MKRRRSRQQAFLWKSHGGQRAGAGRKPRPENVGLLPHCARPAFEARVPVHVTMRAMRGVPSLRSEVIAAIVVGELARASKDGFRVVHDSIQTDHLHLIVEADDGAKLSRGVQRLAARIARLVNAVVKRRGTFWRERYHRRDLGTPRQFRNALVYVTMNYRKHAPTRERAERMNALDLLSSAIWLDDWKSETFAAYVREHRARAGPRTTVLPRTWIARVGWKRLGRLGPRECPKLPG